MWNLYLRITLLAATICVPMIPGYSLAAEVQLPPFSVLDTQESVVSSDTLLQAEPWILIVVASNNQASRALLNELQKSNISWTDRIAIIVSGDQATTSAMKKQNSKLGNAVWYRDPDGTIVPKLGLGGWPAVLGIVPGGLVSWRVVGVPATTQATQALVANWIGLVVKP